MQDWQVRASCEAGKEEEEIGMLAAEELLKALRKDKVDIPFQTQLVYVKQEV